MQFLTLTTALLLTALAASSPTPKAEAEAEAVAIAKPQLSQLYCMQEWFGTAPLCNGKCPNGWYEVKRAKKAGDCQYFHEFKVIESCMGLTKHTCTTGTKVLCEQCHQGH